jgi:hypothetical protein
MALAASVTANINVKIQNTGGLNPNRPIRVE